MNAKLFLQPGDNDKNWNEINFAKKFRARRKSLPALSTPVLSPKGHYNIAGPILNQFRFPGENPDLHGTPDVVSVIIC
jgi:hypothetical protein